MFSSFNGGKVYTLKEIATALNMTQKAVKALANTPLREISKNLYKIKGRKVN
jgi:hypothetical protein